MLWEWRGIANMDFIQLGGSSRVGEMILARERSGFAGEKANYTPGIAFYATDFYAQSLVKISHASIIILHDQDCDSGDNDIVLVSPEEPTRKSKRVKRPAKKSTNVPTAGVVIRETPVMSLSKKKEKMTVEKCKGIDLLSEVALTEEAQYEEVRKKSLKDFHMIHPSGSGTVTKIAPSAAKLKPSVTDEGTGAKLKVPDVTKEESTESNDQESDSGDNDTQSDKEKGSDSEHETNKNETGSESDQEDNEEEVEDDEEEKDEEFVEDKAKGDEDKEMDYTTDQFDDDVAIRLNEPVNTDKGFIQKEGTNAEMINIQQGNET
ncbi:hypothetical protein Tco_0735228 [Tanacetum coccineum]